MTDIHLESLTFTQLLQKHKELQIAYSDLKTKAAVEKAQVEKTHADAMRGLRTKHTELENEYKKFKSLHAKEPAIFLADYEHKNGLYINKAHPEWGYFCGGCIPRGIAANMRKCDAGWQCNACPNFIYNEDLDGH